MKISLCYSGIKDDDIYKLSINSLLTNIYINCVKLYNCDYTIYEFSDDYNVFNEMKYSKYDGGPTFVKTKSIEPMFYKIYESNKLKNQSDITIRVRFDFILNQKLDITNMNMNKYNIPNNGAISVNGNVLGVCDFFAISSSKNMDKYSDLYNNLDELFETSLLSNPESLLCKHLGIENINLFDVDHYILRKDGSKLKFWNGVKELSDEQKKQLKNNK